MFLNSRAQQETRSPRVYHVTHTNTIIASVLGSVALVVALLLAIFCARRRVRRKARRAALNEEAAHSDYSHEMPYGSQPMRYVEPMPEPETSPVERRRERLGHLGGVRDIDDTIVKARAVDLATMTDGSMTLHSTLHANGTDSPGSEPAGDERKLAASPMPNTFIERMWIAPKDRGLTELPSSMARPGVASRDGRSYRGGASQQRTRNRERHFPHAEKQYWRFTRDRVADLNRPARLYNTFALADV